MAPSGSQIRFGVDVGGTKSLGVSIDQSGSIVDSCRVPTSTGPEAITAAILSVIEHLGRSSGCDPGDHRGVSIGIGIAGLVTPAGVVRASPNLVGIADFDLRTRMQHELGRPIAVDNDATCAMVAEWEIGAARGCNNAVLVTLGTGIGGSVVLGGMIQRGEHGFVGEFGHLVVDPNGIDCVCGRRGCWERYASGAGLAALGQRAATAGAAIRLLDAAEGDPSEITGEMVWQLAAEGDADALGIVDEFCWWIALGLVNLTNAFDPAVIVLGGGLVRAADLYLGRIGESFTELLYSPKLRPHPELVVAECGEFAGAVGAAMLGGSLR